MVVCGRPETRSTGAVADVAIAELATRAYIPSTIEVEIVGSVSTSCCLSNF